MRTDLINSDSPRWKEVLTDTAYDFYHLPEYVSLSARKEGGDAVMFIAEENDNRFLLPMILRPVDICIDKRSQHYDATCPYGYPGPLLKAENPRYDTKLFLNRAVDSLLNNLRYLNIISVFSRLHPILTLPLEPL